MNDILGFVGLGIMGRAMAGNLLKHQPLVLYNRTAARAAELASAGAGATVAGSPAEVAGRTTVVFTMVTDDDALEAVVTGPNGILEGIRPGALVVDHSTVSPAVTRRLAALVAERGGAWCDAPVTGGDVGARNGTLTIMVGGAEADFARALPYLQQMGRRILHVGAVGQGQALKLISNMVSALNLMAAAEGVRMGLEAGLSLDALDTVMTNGSAESYELAKVLDRLRRQDFAPGFSVANRFKDLALAVDLAGALSYPVPLAEAALPVYRQHRDSGFADLDEASYIRRWPDPA